MRPSRFPCCNSQCVLQRAVIALACCVAVGTLHARKFAACTLMDQRSTGRKGAAEPPLHGRKKAQALTVCLWRTVPTTRSTPLANVCIAARRSTVSRCCMGAQFANAGASDYLAGTCRFHRLQKMWEQKYKPASRSRRKHVKLKFATVCSSVCW
jgi:hypothetical protein